MRGGREEEEQEKQSKKTKQNEVFSQESALHFIQSFIDSNCFILVSRPNKTSKVNSSLSFSLSLSLSFPYSYNHSRGC